MIKNLMLVLLAAGTVLSVYGDLPEHKTVLKSRPATAMAFNGRYIALAGYNFFQLFDTKDDPKSPVLVSEIKGLPKWDNRQMVFKGHYVYMTARSRGLWVIDIANPSVPRICGNFDTIELATGIDVSGDVLFVTHRDYGIEVFDISIPEKPVHRAHFRTFEAQSCFCDKARLAVGNWGCSTLQFFDVSDPVKAKAVSEVKLDGFGDGVFISGNTAYAATGHHSSKGSRAQRHGAGHGLEIFDISDLAHPRRLSTLKFDRFWALGNDFWIVAVSGKYAAVADTHNGVYIVDISNPAAPKIAFSGKLPEQKYGKDLRHECVTGIAPGKGVVYFTGDRTGLHTAVIPGMIPVSVRKEELRFISSKEAFPEFKKFRRIPSDTMVRRLYADGERLFAACSDGGIRCYGKEGNLLASWPDHGIAFDVVADGDTLYVIENTNLCKYRIGDGMKLKKIASRFTGNSTFLRFLPGKKQLLAYGGGGKINCFDVSGEKPESAGSYIVRRILYSDDVSENFVEDMIAVNAYGDGTYFLRLENGKLIPVTKPSLKTNSSHINGPVFLGKKLFLGGNSGRNYFLIDSEKPWEIREFSVSGLSGIPTLDGKRMILADRRNGKVTVADVSAPEKIRVINVMDLLPATADKVQIFQGKIAIPAGYAGIYLEK